MYRSETIEYLSSGIDRMTIKTSTEKSSFQIRPIFPPSSPLSWEVADDETSQPSCRITCGFTVKWFQKRMKLDYSEQWHTDPDHRWQTNVQMRKVLNKTFPRLNLGGSNPDQITGTISTAHGTAWLPAILLGTPIKYFHDNQPSNVSDRLMDE